MQMKCNKNYIQKDRPTYEIATIIPIFTIVFIYFENLLKSYP